MINHHSRILPHNFAHVFGLLEDMGTEKDRVWPEAKITFKRTPGPMRVGVTTEKHGLIKATLAEYVKNERIVWLADLPFLKGTHGFYLESQGENRTKISHVLTAQLRWWFIPIWHFSIASIHDRIVEGIFDRLQG